MCNLSSVKQIGSRTRMNAMNRFSHGELDGAGKALVDTLFQRQPPWTVASISGFDAAFFSGLVIAAKPTKMVEVGVASGWGSVVMLSALEAAGVQDYEYVGVDIADRFFYDSQYATGEAVTEVLPDSASKYSLMTGRSIGEVAGEIGGGVDFAFIDAHHMHPWATLDLLALLPFMVPESWVALHDLSLCLKADQDHHNRGPKYLFEGWDGEKVHSIQEPTMAGAIRLGALPEEHLSLLIDVLYTPWEMPVDQRFIAPIEATIADNYGSEWGQKLARAAEVGNYFANKMHATEAVAPPQSLKSTLALAARQLSGALVRPFRR